MSAANKIIREDVWLGGILGKKSYIVSLGTDIASLRTNMDSLAGLEVLKEKEVFAFTKIDVTNIPAIGFAEGLGFRLIDTNTLLLMPDARSGMIDPAFSYGMALAEDAERTAELAGKAFIYSRFHQDEKVSKEIADDIKLRWVANFFKGKRGDFMVLAKDGERVIGFNQIISKDDGFVIDLIAVDPDYRRKGIASGLIQFAINSIPGTKKVWVGTQIANIASLKLYQKMGFYLEEARYVFHYHS